MVGLPGTEGTHTYGGGLPDNFRHISRPQTAVREDVDDYESMEIYRSEYLDLEGRWWAMAGLEESETGVTKREDGGNLSALAQPHEPNEQWVKSSPVRPEAIESSKVIKAKHTAPTSEFSLPPAPLPRSRPISPWSEVDPQAELSMANLFDEADTEHISHDFQPTMRIRTSQQRAGAQFFGRMFL